MATTEMVKLADPQKRTLSSELAEQYGMEPGKFLETVKATVFPSGASVTNEQLAAFLIVARQYNLNPFIREIYAFPGRGSGIVPIVSIDGWASLINRQPNLDGIEFQDRMSPEGKILAITCRIFRKDRAKPTEVTEYLAECARETDPWKKWPARMLRHKALIQCARYAFSLSGIHDEDEATRIESVQPTGRLELEEDSPLSTPQFAERAAEVASARVPGGNAAVFYQVGQELTIVYGRTQGLKDLLPKLGAKWHPEPREWRMPAARTHELLEACEEKQIPIAEVAAEKSKEPGLF